MATKIQVGQIRVCKEEILYPMYYRIEDIYIKDNCKIKILHGSYMISRIQTWAISAIEQDRLATKLEILLYG